MVDKVKDMVALRGPYKQGGISALLDVSSCAQAHGFMCAYTDHM